MTDAVADLDLIVAAALEAGHLAVRMRDEGLTVEIKPDKTQVTNADLVPLGHPDVADLRVDLTDAGATYSALAGLAVIALHLNAAVVTLLGLGLVLCAAFFWACRSARRSLSRIATSWCTGTSSRATSWSPPRAR